MKRMEILFSLSLMVFFGVGLACCVNPASGTSAHNPPDSVNEEAIDLHNTGFDAFTRGNYSVALEYYNRSIAADPNYTRAWVDKGNVLIRLNRSDEAVIAYDGALKRDNSLAVVWNSRGEALMATGDYSRARDSFEHALTLAPRFAEAQENLNNVSKKI